MSSPNFEDAVYQDPVEAIYNTVYAPALDKFLETQWYTMSGLNALRRDSDLFAEFVAFFRAASNDREETSPPNLLAQETRLIWKLLNMCCTMDTTSEEFLGARTRPPQDVAVPTNNATRYDDMDLSTQQPTTTTQDPGFAFGELPDTTNDLNLPTISTSMTTRPLEDPTASIPSARVKALTTLIMQTPAPNLHDPPTIPDGSSVNPHSSYRNLTPLAQQLKAREDEFWSCVGRFVSAVDMAERKKVLDKARSLLDGFENRDVVFTIMRLRWLQSVGAQDVQGEPKTGVAEKDKDLAVSRVEKEFLSCMDILRHEAGLAGDDGDGLHSGIGKNVVAMRVAAMALRAFFEI